MKGKEILIPGSKYIANRVLILSALAQGKSIIRNVPDNLDIRIMKNSLKNSGISINVTSDVESGENVLEVMGIDSPETNLKDSREIDAGESGTFLRFVLGFACLLEGETFLTAGYRNRERPIKPLIKALCDLGANITPAQNKSLYPLRIKKGLTGGQTVIDGEVSSQFVSSLLIVAPFAQNDVEIKVNKPIVSSCYIDLTIREMEKFGVWVNREKTDGYHLFKIKAGQRYKPSHVFIPKDWSSTNYLIAASVILSKKISIHQISPETNPGESEFSAILQGMGSCIEFGSGTVSIQKSDILHGIEVDMKDSPDSVLTLIAVALFAEGTTVIKNIGHLIYKESNRIIQVEKELKKLGADISTTENSITISGGNKLLAATTETHNDHRLAMCLGLIQLRNKKMKIRNKECVEKSFPEFWTYLSKIENEGEKCLVIQ